MISGKTKVVGIFGQPIEHSMSPVIQNAAFEHLSLDYTYVPFLVKAERLAKAVDSIRVLNLVGVNVTIPHKETVLPFLDELSQEARLIGAVNVIVNHGGSLKGYNTDGQGFTQSLRYEANTDPKWKKVVLIGAGGAARAVAVQLALEEAREICLVNRNLEKAQKIADVVNENTTSRALVYDLNKDLRFLLQEADIVINTTPIGMHPKHLEPPVIDPLTLSPDTLVCDLVYNPSMTTLIKAAEQRGCQILKGTGMLIYQGALAFEKWTGLEAPVEIMYKALLERLT